MQNFKRMLLKNGSSVEYRFQRGYRPVENAVHKDHAFLRGCTCRTNQTRAELTDVNNANLTE